MTLDSEDAFIGAWDLEPELSQYEMGEPPTQGEYVITPTKAGYHFSFRWETVDGQSRSAAYDAVPDGKQYEYEDPQIAEFVSLTRVDEKILDSSSYKGEQQIAHARRELLDDGDRMRVTQGGRLPDGSWFSNVSYYARRA